MALPDHPQSGVVETEFETIYQLLSVNQRPRFRYFWQGLLEPLVVGLLGDQPRNQGPRRPTDQTESWFDFVGQRATRASFRVDNYRSSVNLRGWTLVGFIGYQDGARIRYFRRRKTFKVGDSEVDDGEYFEVHQDVVLGTSSEI